MPSTKREITSVAIYPPIGLARVGNSDEYYLAPEMPGQPAHAEGGFKDGTGRIKKQVVRFRVYGLDQDGGVVKELTDKNAKIEWRVHVANRKASWYQFLNALDLEGLAIPAGFRNGSVRGADRAELTIDPGPRTICGAKQSGPEYRFSGGTFYGKEVPLGELRTDKLGRLLFFGGDGHSASKDGSAATTFANNDGWHDDVADGPVRATVTYKGKKLEAEPALAVVTPPNFGQGLYGVVTMFDVVLDLYYRIGWLKPPERVNFWDQIYPIFERLSQSQWVNAGFFMLFGQNSPSDFTAPGLLNQLSDPSPAAQPLREKYFQWLRNPNQKTPSPADFPPFYGDAFGDYKGLAQVDLPFTQTQYAWLERWAAGDFDTERRPVPHDFDELTPEEQTRSLSIAPLEECLGGPFHPGIEMTWPLRQQIFWAKPFRPKVLPEGQAPGDNYGPLLAPAIALAPGGPLDGSGPGSITRWLGVPWQTDESSCLSGYTATWYLPLPSFWAARVPNQILSADSFKRLSDPRLNIGQRLKHFDYRQDWLRDLGTQYETKINNMIAEWHELGIVAPHVAAPDAQEPLLPTRYWVETGRGPYAPDPTFEQVRRAEDVRDEVKRKLAAEPARPAREPRTFERHER